MPEFEARWPCPVCAGLNLEKARVSETLVLDHCARCGGVWLDAGEAERLPGTDPQVFWSLVARRGEVVRALCRHCGGVVPRDQDRCPSCGKAQGFKCPTCDQPMRKAQAGGVTLDRCEVCKGVWFDHHELDTIWQRAAEKVAGGKPLAVDNAIPEVVGGVIEFAAWNPGLALYGADAAGRALAGAAEVVAHTAPGLLAGAAEGAADLAAAAFEAIAEIIGSLFSS